MPDYNSNGGTPTDEVSVHPDYSLPLYDEVNGMPDMPDTVPWCPEEETSGVVPMVGAGMDPIVPKTHRLPEIAYGSFSVFTANGTGVAQNVGFPINAVIVDNYTPQWCRIGNQWVAPFSINGVLKVPSSTKQAEVVWEAPTGVTQPASVSGALLRATYCEEPLDPSAFTVLSGGGTSGSSGAVATAATATNTNVASSATSVTILASNASRRGASVFNDSTQILYLDLAGDVASTTNYTVQLATNAFYELPPPAIYTGKITGIWAAANGNARVTELT
jgi:hypothetical protein